MDTIETFLDNMFAPYPATPTSAVAGRHSSPQPRSGAQIVMSEGPEPGGFRALRSGSDRP